MMYKIKSEVKADGGHVPAAVRGAATTAPWPRPRTARWCEICSAAPTSRNAMRAALTGKDRPSATILPPIADQAREAEATQWCNAVASDMAEQAR